MPHNAVYVTIRFCLNNVLMTRNSLLIRSFAAAAVFFVGTAAVRAQADPTPSPTPTPAAASASTAAGGAKGQPQTAEQIVESAIIFYGGLGGRERLEQIRKTTQERGTLTTIAADGKTERSSYTRWALRGETLEKERVRLDQNLPSARYSLVFNEGNIFLVFNNTVFAAREDVARAFENQLFHGLDALLRYKENGSTLELQPREKLMGVDYFVVDITDSKGRTTRFYISAKTYRVMLLTYEFGGVKYTRRFYDYKYAQNTLVPYRTVLFADDRRVEEYQIGTITFGQKVDEELFRSS